MPGEPTEREATKEAAREELSNPRFGTVEKVYHHTETGDDSNHEADVILSGTDTRIPEAHIQQPTPGMVALPREGALVQLVWVGGEKGEPVITGSFHDAEARAPTATEGVFAFERGGTRLELRPNGNVTIAAGQDLSIDAEGTIALTDSQGTLTTAGAGGGGGGVGVGGGSFPSAAPGTAGGDGTGVGNPGFSPTTTVDAVDGLGMDPTGDRPVNDALKSLESDTLLEIPTGTYRVRPEGTSGIVLGQNNLWLQGTGGKRGDVRFQFPDGKAARMFNLQGRVAMSNLTFDQSNHPAAFVNVAMTSGQSSYLYNVQHDGKSPNEVNIGEPFHSNVGEGVGDAYAINVGMDNGATARVENYSYTDPEVGIISYDGRNNTGAMIAPNGHNGLLEAVNCRIEYRGEHSIYGSRAAGNVQVTGGYFANCNNTNMRISGSGSWITDATIRIDMDPSRQIEQDTGTPKATRGLRVESGDYNFAGGYAENVDFIHTSNMPTSPLVEINDSTSDFTVRNCRFYSENDETNMVNIDAPGVVIRDSSFTGPTSQTPVVGNGSTEVLDCCSVVSSDFQNCTVRGLKTAGCEEPDV